MLNLLKNKVLLKSVRKSKLREVPLQFDFAVKTVGIIMDKQSKDDLVALKAQLVLHGVLEKDVSVLCCSEGSSGVEGDAITYLGYKDFNMQGKTSNVQVLEFVEKKFDLLIAYTSMLPSIAQWAVVQSQASFKIGVLSGYDNLHHLEIDSILEGKGGFIDSVFEYIGKFKS